MPAPRGTRCSVTPSTPEDTTSDSSSTFNAMDTPLKSLRIDQRRKYTAEEKQQLLRNLELEVAHRTRQFEESLAQILENFKNHHEGQVLRVPKLVRNITMAEFADKYNGDINECLRGLQRERQGGESSLADLELRKRKWRLMDESLGPDHAESSRAPKQARVVSSPSKIDPSKLHKFRTSKPPGSARTSRHPHAPFVPSSPLKPSSLRPPSPSKPSTRPPTSKEFRPMLPKTPAYPRAPRMDESLMSVNGSPLANPLQQGFAAVPEEGGEDDANQTTQTLRRSRSIVIRRGPSTILGSSQPSGSHSRVPSQSSMTRSERSSSHTTHSSTDSFSSIPTSENVPLDYPSAFMRVPTKDGLVLEFDPLSTSPDELDALEGITDSAKKQAKEDMTRLVQTALARWKLS